MYFFQTVRLFSIFTAFDVAIVLLLQLNLLEFRFQAKVVAVNGAELIIRLQQFNAI